MVIEPASYIQSRWSRSPEQQATMPADDSGETFGVSEALQTFSLQPHAGQDQ